MPPRPGPRAEVAKALTNDVLADLTALEEITERVLADLKTLERWGAALDLPAETRARLGLPPQEPAVTKERPLVRKPRPPGSVNAFINDAVRMMAEASASTRWVEAAMQSVDVDAVVEAQLGAQRATEDAQAFAAAILADGQSRQEELSSIDYAVQVLRDNPDQVMDIGDIADAMHEAGWQTAGTNIRNIVAAVLGKAAEKHSAIERPGRGQYVWKTTSEFDLGAIPELSLGEPSSEEKKAEVPQP